MCVCEVIEIEKRPVHTNVYKVIAYKRSGDFLPLALRGGSNGNDIEDSSHRKVSVSNFQCTEIELDSVLLSTGKGCFDFDVGY